MGAPLPRYFCFTPDGRLVGAAKTVEGGYQELLKSGFKGEVYAEDIGPITRTNPGRQESAPSQSPTKALRRLGMAPIPASAIDRFSSIAQAFERLYPITSQTRVHGRLPKTMSDPKTFMRSLFDIDTNLKLSKSASTPSSPWSNVVNGNNTGLSLIPADKISTWKEEYQLPQQRSALITRLLQKLLPGIQARAAKAGGFTMCGQASPMCKSTCLVNTGQNVTVYAGQRKLALTLCLLTQPAAFLYILREAAKRYVRRCRAGGKSPFMRLNVYSDVPWELLAPSFVEDLNGMGITLYDYTKIVGRNPKNYDITFSFSGTNLRSCQAESERHRIAVILLSHEIRQGHWSPIYSMAEGKHHGGTVPIPAGEKLWGMRIIDGDHNDYRPLDPPGILSKSQGRRVVVGLSYKVSSRLGLMPTEQKKIREKSAESAMVIPAYAVDGIPGDRKSLKWIVGPLTPPNEPVSTWMLDGGVPEVSGPERAITGI